MYFINKCDLDLDLQIYEYAEEMSTDNLMLQSIPTYPGKAFKYIHAD